MAEARKIVVRITTDGSKAEAEVKKTAGVFDKILTGVFERIGHRITDSLIGAFKAGGRALKSFVKDGVKTAAEFDEALREVATLGAENMDGLRTGIESVSMALGEDLVTSTKAVYQALSASVPEKNVLSFVEVAAKAARAGLTDTETSVDALTSVLNAYGLEAERAADVSDLFFTTIRLGKTRYEELAGSIGRLAPLARNANVSMEEMFSTIAALTQVGLSTEEAITGVRSSITQLLKPTDDAAQILDRMGFNAANMAETLGEQGLIGVLSQIAGDSPTSLKNVISDVRGLNAAMALVGSDGGEKAASILEEMQKAAGATDEAFGKVREGFNLAVNRFVALMDVLKVEVFQPWLELGARVLNEIVDWFSTEKGVAAIDAAAEFSRNLAKKFGEQFDAFMKGEITFSELVAGWIEQARVSIAQIIDRARPFIDGLAKAFVDALGRAIKASVPSMMEGIIGMVNRINPFAYAATGLGQALDFGGSGQFLGPSTWNQVNSGNVGIGGVAPETARAESAPVINVNGLDMPLTDLASRVADQMFRYRTVPGVRHGVAFGG